MDDHAEHAGLIASIRLLQDDVERHRRRTRWALFTLGAIVLALVVTSALDRRGLLPHRIRTREIQLLDDGGEVAGVIGMDGAEIVIAAIPPGVVFRVGGVPALFIRRGDQVIFPGVPDGQPQPAQPTGPAEPGDTSDTPAAPDPAQDPAAPVR